MALKNQKRTEKIGVAETRTSNISQSSNSHIYQGRVKTTASNRTRVASGMPFQR